MARQATKKVYEVVGPVVEGLGYELVGIEYLPQGKHSLLRIYIDKQPDGISVSDCEAVSRQAGSVLDVEDPISGQYTLEVSSPGLDRPLFTLEHYGRFIGHNVKLRLRQMVNGRRKMTAVVKECHDDGKISVEVDGEVFQVEFDDIEQARLVPDFDKR